MTASAPLMLTMGIRSSLRVQPLELTQKTAASLVKAAAWIDSSAPGMPTVDTLGASAPPAQADTPDTAAIIAIDLKTARIA
jgi:hypothetical protein